MRKLLVVRSCDENDAQIHSPSHSDSDSVGSIWQLLYSTRSWFGGRFLQLTNPSFNYHNQRAYADRKLLEMILSLHSSFIYLSIQRRKIRHIIAPFVLKRHGNSPGTQDFTDVPSDFPRSASRESWAGYRVEIAASE